MYREVKRRIRAPGARGRLALLALLLAALPAPAQANEASAGVLLRRARYAIVEGRQADAASALREARAKEPHTRRGLEAALLLADLEFSRGNGAAADEALAAAERDFADGEAGAQVLLARGWLALARQDASSATRHFGLVASRSSQRFANELATLGLAWARLTLHAAPSDVPSELRPLVTRGSDPALRVAAGLTLARAHRARGEHKLELRWLRALRRLVRGSTFSDDVELAIGLAQLDAGAPAAARKTFERLAKTAPATSAREGAAALTLLDLRLPPQTFVARVSRLYAERSEKGAGILPFLMGTLDRPAAADAAAALGLADAAIAARKGA
ncbi:MAG: hypothetical protein AB1689_25115 [Thermodesulfobacteriota bacterium]